MALEGTCSGVLDIASPADKFFEEFLTTTLKKFDLDKIESLDPEKNSMTFGISACLIEDFYKTAKATITVTPKEDGDGGHVVWTVAYEKIRHDLDEPQLINDILINFFKETDKKLNRN